MKARHIIAITALLAWGSVLADDGVRWDKLNDGQKQVLSIYSEGWEQLEPNRRAVSRSGEVDPR